MCRESLSNACFVHFGYLKDEATDVSHRCDSENVLLTRTVECCCFSLGADCNSSWWMWMADGRARGRRAPGGGRPTPSFACLFVDIGYFRAGFHTMQKGVSLGI